MWLQASLLFLQSILLQVCTCRAADRFALKVTIDFKLPHGEQTPQYVRRGKLPLSELSTCCMCRGSQGSTQLLRQSALECTRRSVFPVFWRPLSSLGGAHGRSVGVARFGQETALALQSTKWDKRLQGLQALLGMPLRIYSMSSICNSKLQDEKSEQKELREAVAIGAATGFQTDSR